MDFIDLKAQQKRINEKLNENIRKVLAHGHYIMGPEVGELEAKLTAYVGAKHGVGCASGTDALLMALMALDIGPGDAVFTTPFTFVATAEVVSLLGATPVFVDIDPATFNMDIRKLEEAVQTLKSHDSSPHPLPRMSDSSHLSPRAIIPVDLFGLPADYDAIEAIAKKHGLAVIEDAAQSFGAEYKGRKACSFGQIGCTSFFPAKPLGCYGDGGMCFTDNDALAEKLRSVRVHGQGPHKYENVRIGINGRLDTLQAAVLLAKFEIFPEEIELRQKAATMYGLLLAQAPHLRTPRIPEGYKSAWAQYSLLTENDAKRTTLMNRLKEQDIPIAIYYPKPLHLQTAFTGLGYRTGDFPASEDCTARIFSIPMHPYLAKGDQERIATTLTAT